MPMASTDAAALNVNNFFIRLSSFIVFAPATAGAFDVNVEMELRLPC
jgi:hypothetical protein